MPAVFFYGLFMDDTLLKDKGLNPGEPTIAYVDDYVLRIGARATLVTSKGKQAYGTVMYLTEQELAELYAEPSVADYIETPIQVVLSGGGKQDVVTYLLPEALLTGQNLTYVGQLALVARKMRLPDDYVSEISSLNS